MWYILTLATEVNIDERIICGWGTWLLWEKFYFGGGRDCDLGCRKVSALNGIRLSRSDPPHIPGLPESVGKRKRSIETSLCWYETKGRGIQMKNTFRKSEFIPSQKPLPSCKDLKRLVLFPILSHYFIKSHFAIVSPGHYNRSTFVILLSIEEL